MMVEDDGLRVERCREQRRDGGRKVETTTTRGKKLRPGLFVFYQVISPSPKCAPEFYSFSHGIIIITGCIGCLIISMDSFDTQA